MSLLVINSRNRIANGLISHIGQLNLYETIVCADRYPYSFDHKRWLKFKDKYDKISSKTRFSFSDITFENESDFSKIIKQDIKYSFEKSPHILFVNDDYFTNSFKRYLLVNLAEIAAEFNIKKLVAVNPIEHDFHDTKDSEIYNLEQEEIARKTYQDLLLVKSDLVFGNYSTVINQLIRRISNGINIDFSPSINKVSPIHADNLAEIVINLLGNNDAKGNTYLAKGNNQIDWNHILNTLEKAVGKKAVFGNAPIHSFYTYIFDLCEQIRNSETHRMYINMVQYINRYASPSGNYTDISSFGLKLKEFNQEYQENSINAENFKPKYDDEWMLE